MGKLKNEQNGGKNNEQEKNNTRRVWRELCREETSKTRTYQGEGKNQVIRQKEGSKGTQLEL